MILCCGESLIDMLPRPLVGGGDGFAPHPGGAVFNTAIALGRLGADVGLFSGVSDDLFGTMLFDALVEANVETSQLVRSARPTTLAFVTLTDGHARYTFYDEGTAGRMLSEADLPDLTPAAAFFGGISLVSEPCGSAYEALMTRLAPTTTMMIDPNVRPSFITDEAAYRARIGRMMRLADIVKSSDEDLKWLTGGTDATVLFEGSATHLALLTRGAGGITLLTRSGTIDVPAEKARVVDTVGAGDTFNAGFLAGLQRDGLLERPVLANVTSDELTPAVRLGAKAAAITVSRAGANPPWARELA